MRNILLSVIGGFLFIESFGGTLTAQAEYTQQDIDTTGFGRAVTAFSLDILKSVYDSRSASKNTLFSPSSLYKTLLALYLGSTGDSKVKLAKALHLDNVKQYSTAGNINVWRKLKSAEVLEDERLFHDDSINISDGIKNLLGDDLQGLPFQSSTSKEVINGWASDVTQSHIKEVIKDEPGSNVKFLTTGVVYNKPDWEITFPTYNTQSGIFHLSDKTTKSVTFMGMTYYLLYYKSESLKCKVLTLKYKTPELSFVMFLPDEGQTVSSVIASLTVEEIEKAVNNREKDRIVLKLPKFTMEEMMNVSGLCETLGICDLFAPGEADLTGFTHDSNFHVGDALQKVVIEVTDEGNPPPRGTKGRGGIENFDANHPFVYMVYNNLSKMPVLMGTLMNPGQ